MLSPFAIPRIDGVPVGRYRLLLGTRTESFSGVRYVNGRSVEPVDGRTILRQHQAFGDVVRVEPWDEETARRVLAYGENHGRPDVVEAMEGWLRARAEPGASDEDGDSDGGTGAQPDELEAMSVDDLRAFAELREIVIDKRWGEKRLREEIRKATDAAPSDEDDEGDDA